MNLFRQTVIDRNVRNRLNALRHNILAIPAISLLSDDKIVANYFSHLVRFGILIYLCT
jgi:hypothetical protein